mgnify:CR=1 FL=1
MTYIDQVKNDLIDDEGRRNFPYDDATGARVKCEGNITIGVGWNLENGLPNEIIDRLLDIGIERAMNDCVSIFPHFISLPDSKKRVLINLAFNMGRDRLLTFKKMIAAINERDFKKAAEELMDSKWAMQVQKSRSTRLQLLLEQDA